MERSSNTWWGGSDEEEEEAIDSSLAIAAELPGKGSCCIAIAPITAGLRPPNFGDNPKFFFNQLYTWDRILEVKKAIAYSDGLEVAVDKQILFYHGKELSSEATLADCKFASDEVTVLDLQDTSKDTNALSVYGRTSTAPSTQELVVACNEGFKLELAPRLSDEGTGATYFLHNEHGEQIACFKPGDEEQNAVNNPRSHDNVTGGLTDTMSRIDKLFTPGEQHLREIAAYMIDEAPHMLPQYQHFHDVPKTTRCIISTQHQEVLKHFHYQTYSSELPAKVGSLQKFVRSDGEVCDDSEASIFSNFEVHKIGILDIRLLNCDRTANILVVRDGNSRIPKLVPIDHGLCLPKRLELGWCDWSWMSWPQAKAAFDPFTLKFIDAIDIEKDIERIRDELSIDWECLRSMKVNCLVLKLGAKHGLNLHDIATIITRQDLDQPSSLELLCVQAEALAQQSTSFTWKHVSPKALVEDASPATSEQTSPKRPDLVGKDSTEEYVEGVKFLDSTNDTTWKRTQSCLGFFDDTMNLFGSKPKPAKVSPSSRVMNPSPRRQASKSNPEIMTRSASSDSEVEPPYRPPNSPSSISSSTNDINELTTQRSLNDSQVSMGNDLTMLTTFNERFFHYIEKLVEIQCMNFRKNQVSNEPDVYDNETMMGTFTGLQSLEKQKTRFNKRKTEDYGALMTCMLSTPVMAFDLDYNSDHEEDDRIIQEDDYDNTHNFIHVEEFN